MGKRVVRGLRFVGRERGGDLNYVRVVSEICFIRVYSMIIFYCRLSALSTGCRFQLTVIRIR